MGEHAYREWFLERLEKTPLPLYFGCLLGEIGLTGLIGVGLIFFSPEESIPFAIGFGIVGYSGIVLFYTSLSVWRLRRRIE